MRSFGSDNNSGIHPAVIDAIAAANRDHTIAYGDDPWTEKATTSICKVFGEEAFALFVFNGTGANTVAIRACTRPYHAVLCSSMAHIAVDECGAPGLLSGCAIKEIDTPNGKLTPELIQPLLHGFGFEHHSQPKVVYISQCSELGTVYTREEIRAIADLIHPYGMYLHMDGARLANAAVKLNCSFKEMTVDCGVDILSFGGTKNGLMMGEAVISFRRELNDEMKYYRKQSTQLFSKMRFSSCQFLPYLENELWRKNAAHANRMAQRLRAGIEASGKGSFTQPTDANILLLTMPREVSEKLLERYFFYTWNETNNEIRLVTSWDTTEEDIDGLLDYLQTI